MNWAGHLACLARIMVAILNQPLVYNCQFFFTYADTFSLHFLPKVRGQRRHGTTGALECKGGVDFSDDVVHVTAIKHASAHVSLDRSVHQNLLWQSTSRSVRTLAEGSRSRSRLSQALSQMSLYWDATACLTITGMIQKNASLVVFTFYDRASTKQYIVRHECTSSHGVRGEPIPIMGHSSCYIPDFIYDRSSTRGYAARGF